MNKNENNMNLTFMNEIFRERENIYNPINGNELVIPRMKTVNFGSESIRYRWPQLKFSLPQDIRNTESISLFKSKIKSGTVENAVADYVDLLFQPSDFCDVFHWAISSLHFMSFLLYQTDSSNYHYQLYICR